MGSKRKRMLGKKENTPEGMVMGTPNNSCRSLFSQSHIHYFCGFLSSVWE